MGIEERDIEERDIEGRDVASKDHHKQHAGRQFILSEIRRTAEENGGVALGVQRFERVTGISRFQWYTVYWTCWGDAVAEAGLPRNTLQAAYSDDRLLRALAVAVRSLGHFPSRSEMLYRAKHVPSFPSTRPFDRLGKKQQLIELLTEFCRQQPGWNDVLAICERLVIEQQHAARQAQAKCVLTSRATDASGATHVAGYIYLFKARRYYKVGRTKCVKRRKRQLAGQTPDRLRTVHTIPTDDPPGIEAYWHKRFEAKRVKGEWFELTADDVRAFKRRGFM